MQNVNNPVGLFRSRQAKNTEQNTEKVEKSLFCVKIREVVLFSILKILKPNFEQM